MKLVFHARWWGFYEHGSLVLVVLRRRKGPVPPRRSLIAGSRSTIQVQNLFSSQLIQLTSCFWIDFWSGVNKTEYKLPGIHAPPTQTAVFHVMLPKLLLIIRILVWIPSLVLRPEKVFFFVKYLSSLKKRFSKGSKSDKFLSEQSGRRKC